MHCAHNVRPSEGKDVIVTLEALRVALEALAHEIFRLQLEGLQRSAHGAVHHHHALVQHLPQCSVRRHDAKRQLCTSWTQEKTLSVSRGALHLHCTRHDVSTNARALYNYRGAQPPNHRVPRQQGWNVDGASVRILGAAAASASPFSRIAGRHVSPQVRR